ncbi:hypothetical protein [Streptomyces sp. WMMB 322]|uniref:hypothetical protein n=1 Tax=Streptomyces sp. WMMB 322 TaxID=1286821 RepID=UPI0011131C77|nr:hypothetical protein [Streptomyces sp. WMMB 322]
MLCRGHHGKSALCASLMTFALLTGLAGCSGTDGGDTSADAVPGTPSDGKGALSSPKRSSVSPAKREGASAGAKPTSSALPKAADGTDTGACADGDCEVELSKGDEIHPPSSSGVHEFTVQDIEDGIVTWTARFSGGRVTTSARGMQNSSTSCSNGFCRGKLSRSKTKIEMNRLVIEFKAIGADRAVVRVSAKK